MPVSPLKQPTSIVTSERLFMQPTGLPSQTSSSQPISASQMPVLQSTRPVSQSTTSQSQPNTGSRRCQCCTLPDRSARVLPVKASPIPVSVRCQGCSLPDSQIFSSHTPTGKKVLLTASASCAAAQYNPDSDLEQQIYHSSPVNPMEEEGQVSDQDIVIPEQER